MPSHYLNADLLSIGPLGTNFVEIEIKIENFSFIKMHLKMSEMATLLLRGNESNLNLKPLAHISTCLYFTTCVESTFLLTHWGQETKHIYASMSCIIFGWDNVSSLVPRAITRTNDHLLSLASFGINFIELCAKVPNFSLKMHMKLLLAKCRPFCLVPDVLIVYMQRPICVDNVWRRRC